MESYKIILDRVIRLNVGLWLMLIGLIGVISPYFTPFFMTEIKVGSGDELLKGLTSFGKIIVNFASIFFSIGFTIVIVDIILDRAQKSKMAAYNKGIVDVLKNKEEVLSKYSYSKLVKKYDNLIFIGTRHEALSDAISNSNLPDEILSKGKKFKMIIYFLNPNSPHTTLFDKESGGGNSNKALGTKINVNLINILNAIKDRQELEKVIKLYFYDAVPIGNLSIMDNRAAIINRYTFFEHTESNYWYVLNQDALVSQRIMSFLEKKIIKTRIKINYDYESKES